MRRKALGLACGAALLAVALTAPAQAQIRAGLVNLTSMVTGILPAANGGTGGSSFNAASIIALWTGTCNSSSVLGGDGVCAAVSGAFSGIASGTNTTAAMVVGSGGSLAASGTGTIAATSVTGPSTITGIAGGSALILAGATQTASFPVLSATQTWNNAGVAFTGWKLDVTNTASNANSLLVDLQTGSSSMFKVDRTGIGTFANTIHSGSNVQIYAFGVKMRSDAELDWSSTSVSTGTVDTTLTRVAAGGLRVGSGSSPGINGTLQAGVTASDPGCTTTAHIGKQWFDITTTTTAYKVCLNVAGTVGWVTK